MKQKLGTERLSTEETKQQPTKEQPMTNIYANKAGAAKGAKRKGIKHPEFIELHDGRVVVRERGVALHDASQRIKSEVKNPVKLVWDLCFKQPKAKRRDIVGMAIEKGVSVNTAKTQYQYWRKASGLVRHA